MTAFFEAIRNKKFGYFLMFFILLVTNFITLHIISPNAISFLIFEPWWFIRTMVVVKLGLIDWELRRQHYLYVGRFTSYLRVIQLEGTALLIFITGNLGVRILGLPIIVNRVIHFKKKILNSPIDTFLLTSAFVGFIVPMLFLQKGVVWVSVQFMQYSLLIVGFYGAIFVYSILKKIKLVAVAFHVEGPYIQGNNPEQVFGNPLLWS